MEAIQNYQTVEQQHRQKYKQRLERQYKIVKPDATPDEIRAVVEDDNGGQVFSQAVRIYLLFDPHTRGDRLITIVLKWSITVDELQSIRRVQSRLPGSPREAQGHPKD